MSAFDIILSQCEKQASKLCCMDINDKYINEVDIFNNYFSQLKQVIESEKITCTKDKVDNLLNLLTIFISRLEQEKK